MLATAFNQTPLATLRQQAEAEQGFKRTLGVTQLTLLGIGLVIGTGIFVLTGHVAADNAGPAVCLSFLLAAIPASLATFCYAEMVATVPASGGAYTYVSASLGEMPGFLIGWAQMVSYIVGTATVAAGWSAYFCAFLRDTWGVHVFANWVDAPLSMGPRGGLVPSGHVLNIPAAAVILGCTALLLLGVKKSLGVTAALVVLKLVVVGAFLVAATPVVQVANLQPFIPPNTGRFGHYGVSGVVQGASVAFFAYLGVDNLSTAVQEAKQPHRSVPRALALTLIVCTVLYLLVCLVLTGAVPYTSLGISDPIARGVEATHIRWLPPLISAGSLAGLSAAVLMQLYGLPRILYAMARDGWAPHWAGRLGRRQATPHVTTLAVGGVSALFAALLPVEFISEVTAAATLLAFVCVSAGVAVLRAHHPRLKRTFRVPGGPYIVPGASALGSLFLLCLIPPLALCILGAWLALGLCVYSVRCGVRRRHAHR